MTDKLHFNDLTQIACPFGMLDDDTKKRLKACDDVEYFSSTMWRECTPAWVAGLTYRAKPKPKRVVTWMYWGFNDNSVFCCGTHYDAVWYYNNYHGGYIYKVELDPDGSNPTIELVEAGGKDD